MDKEFLKELAEVAVHKEIVRQNLNLVDLAERHAVEMLDEIVNILNTQISDEAKIEKILKIIVFCPVPPHI